MSKSLRLPEVWFQRGLWAVAIVFALFLNNLGSAVVRDLPKVENRLELSDFMDKDVTAALEEKVATAKATMEENAQAIGQAQLKYGAAKADTKKAQDDFSAWVATRNATRTAGGATNQDAEQDRLLAERTARLEQIRAREREALSRLEALSKTRLDAEQTEFNAARDLRELRVQGQEKLQAASIRQELRVFGYRLLLTLPLLIVAGWLFKRYRKSTWWPFVWGYIIFAGFTFFFELVPYLPSYGGYVRNIVGVVLTVLAGRQAILALKRYQERKLAEESRPETERRKDLSYDQALARLAKSVCPGCERPVDMKLHDFCPHCGICVNRKCGACATRNNAFSRFCHQCGVAPTNS